MFCLLCKIWIATYFLPNEEYDYESLPSLCPVNLDSSFLEYVDNKKLWFILFSEYKKLKKLYNFVLRISEMETSLASQQKDLRTVTEQSNTFQHDLQEVGLVFQEVVSFRKYQVCMVRY